MKKENRKVSLIIRLNPDLHKKLENEAEEKELSLNKLIEGKLQRSLLSFDEAKEAIQKLKLRSIEEYKEWWIHFNS